jgi:predicted lactoylglutathione lyase
MDQRLSSITLGVGDVTRAQRFYEALGWHLDGGVDDENDHIAFFQAGGMILSLWDRDKLAEDGGLSDPGGWGGVTLGYNVNSPEEVEQILAQAADTGGTITSLGCPRAWGGYSGIFVDLDGHSWEVQYNPAWTVHPDGVTRIRAD